MLAYDYKFTNLFNGKSFTIGFDDETGNSVCSNGLGIILQEYPAFEKEVRSEERVKSGQHGIFDFFSFYGKRVITMSGLIKATDHANLIMLERLMQQVMGLPAQPQSGINDGYVLMTWTDDFGITWQLPVKLLQDIQFRRQLTIQNQATFLMTMKSSEAYILSADSYEQSGLMGWRQGALTLENELAAKFNLIFERTVQIYQNGNTDAPATYRLYGPATNPRVTRLDEVPYQNSLLFGMNEPGWVGGTPNNSIYQTGNSSRSLTSLNGVQEEMSITEDLNLDFSDDYLTPLVMSTTDAIGSWTTTGDATNLTVDFAVKQQGNASLNFDIDVSQTVDNYAGLRNTNLTPISIEGYENVSFDINIFIPDVTQIVDVAIDIGSDGGMNGVRGSIAVDYLGNPFVNGWNKVRIFLLDMAPYGTGLNHEDVSSAEIRLNYNVAQADMTDVRFDYLVANVNIRRQYVTFYFYVDNKDNFAIGDYLTGENYVKFETTALDYYVAEFSLGNFTIRNGWNYFRLLKDKFETIGLPNWSTITKTTFSIKSALGSNLTVIFDDVNVKNIAFSEFKLEVATVLPEGFYVDFTVKEGSIYRSDGADLSGFLTLDSQWFFLKPGENTLIYEDDAYDPEILWEFPTQNWVVLWNDALE